MDHKYEVLDRLKESKQIEMTVWMSELVRICKALPVERRAYCIIREYLSLESPTPEQRRDFLLWLTDGENAEAKKNALDRVSYECYCMPDLQYVTIIRDDCEQSRKRQYRKRYKH